MNQRRKFVQKLALGISSALALPKISQAKSKALDYSLKGEDFWEALLKEFPLTSKRVYFNNGTFGPSPNSVLEVLKKEHDYFNEWGEYGSTKEARKTLANFVNVAAEEISLTHNTTEGINIVTWGLPLKKGDEVIITKQEHVGNALPWLNRAKLHGIVLKPFEPAQTAKENLQIVESLITKKTKVIAIPHITCTTGLVMPIKEIAALAKSKGIFTAIDGAHGAGTFNLDLKDLGCDFYATSCHKWMLGPNGSGFVYIRKELLDTLQAYWVGGYSDTGWDLMGAKPHIEGYVPTAHRYDYGSQNAALYAAAAEAANFHTKIGKDKVEARVRELATYLQENLLEKAADKIEMLTPTEATSRISMITFKPKTMDFRAFSKVAAENKFRIRVVPESNLNAIRISTHIYNNKAQIDRFVEMVKDI